MTRYYIEPNLIHPNMLHIYKETDTSLGLALTVHNNVDLAHKILEILNKEENNTN